MDIPKIFGKRLKEIRSELGITQEELAFLCSMQSSHIGQLERGIKSPTLDTLYKIANGLKIAVADLVAFDKKLGLPHNYDEKTNKIIAHLQRLNPSEKSQVLRIVKTFRSSDVI